MRSMSANTRRYARDRAAFDSRSKGSRTKASSTRSQRRRQEDPVFPLDTDYTSANSSAYGLLDPERPLEPKRSKKTWLRYCFRCCCFACSSQTLFLALTMMALISFWTLPLHYRTQGQSMKTQQQQPLMLADFVISASAQDAIVAANASALLLQSLEKPSQALRENEAQPPRLLNVSGLSYVQKGAPEAKFSPETPNQQIDKLLRVNLQKSHYKVSNQRGDSSIVEFQQNDYIHITGNLEQCVKIVSNPSSLKELVYWEQHPADFSQLSPWYQADSRYLIFEPDTGGFSSQRLVLEQMVVLAYALGRTLVLPPRQGMRDGTLLSYEDFFDLRITLSQKYKGLRIVQMEEFLQYVAVAGYLKNKAGMPVMPPWHRTNWDSAPDIGMLYDYLRTVGTVPFDWDPQKCIIGYRTDQLKQQMKRIFRKMDGRAPPTPLHFQGKPTKVNAPEMERLREFLAERREVCQSYQEALALHIPTTSEGKSLLHAPFYSFFFFDDWHEDLLTKRMVRDYMRYNDVITCAAARIIDWLRHHAGVYDAIHIRGPSYEDAHSDVNTNPEWIVHDVMKYIPKGATIYIATDYADATWFNPLRDQYRLYFAYDFKGVFDSLLPWYLEMVEQLICARSRTFVGTYYSSYTGYINRLRGYYSQRDHTEGFEEGEIASYYASPVKFKKDMKIYQALRRPLSMREFPVAWRDINNGVPPATKTHKWV